MTAPPPLPTGMAKIHEGRFYKTRVGQVVGPMLWDEVSRLWRTDRNRNTGDYWHEDGSRYAHVWGDEDLMEEVNQPLQKENRNGNYLRRPPD